MDEIVREKMEVDVLFVGGGPANLAGAIHLASLIRRHDERVEKGEAAGPKLGELQIVLLEKASSFGNHQLSGAVMNPVAFRELFPGEEPPGGVPVGADGFYFLTAKRKLRVPAPGLSNHGNYVVSLSRLARWMAEKAEATGKVNLFPGFAAAELLMDGPRVAGVRTRDAGIDKQGGRRASFEPGIELVARVTVLGEGTRGTLTKQLEQTAGLAEGRAPQSYALGIKEVWRVKPEKHQPGRVIHTLGWPLSARKQVGGGWIYHMAEGLVSIGLVTRLDYDDPLLDPFQEFHRQKLHPWIADLLDGGELLEYGAKSIPEGGWHSIPRLVAPGCLLVGDSASLVNGFKLKGIHYAIKSGMLAAETIFEGLVAGDLSPERLAAYETRVLESYIGRELYKVRNFHSALSGRLVPSMLRIGALMATGGRLLLGRRHADADWRHMKKQADSLVGRLPPEERDLPRHPLVRDRATDLFHSGTQHEENQPSHLVVPDLELCATRCWQELGSPCQRFCPAEVYEMATDPATGKATLVLHPANCVHCKTCDIKDPYENITWVLPEAGGGPRYKLT